MHHLVQIGNDAVVNRGTIQGFNKDGANKQGKRQQPSKRSNQHRLFSFGMA